MPALRLNRFPSPNHWTGRPHGSPIALVIHTEAGSEAGTRAEFTRAGSEKSAHFGVALTGSTDQFVDLEDRAWANGILETGNRWLGMYTGPRGVDPETRLIENPNNWTVSIETEDRGDPNQPVTDAQYASVLAIGQLVLATYPSVKYLLKHADISPHSRANCPGTRWTASGAFQALANTLKLEVL